MKTKLISVILIAYMHTALGQFTGHSGVYYLGAADKTILSSTYSNPDISGLVCRFNWSSLETSPGVFDWTFIDGEIAKAKSVNKKISLQPLGYPAWIKSDLDAQLYYYIDENKNHPTYGKIVSGVLPWDDTYLDRISILMENLSDKYAAEPTVSYINLIGAQISRGIPDTVLTDTTQLIKEAFWKVFDYDADLLAENMYPLIDYYMELFPSTPLWCSVDYVTFEPKASGRMTNYLASLYTDYGITFYPDRFGLFREDISGCTPYPVTNQGSQWQILAANDCRTGAQMLWSVQDGPSRMNKCSMVPNAKDKVLDSAISKGIAFGMRYIEVYGSDVEDAELQYVIASADKRLIEKGNSCSGVTSTMNHLLNEGDKEFLFDFHTNILYVNDLDKEALITLHNTIGKNVFFTKIQGDDVTIDLSDLAGGVYTVLVEMNQGSRRFKICKTSEE